MKEIISKILFVLIPLGVLAMYGCSKMGDSIKKVTKTGEIRYSKKADSVNVFSGRERVKVWMVVSEPNIVMGKVFWNSMEDSVEIPIKSMNGNSDTVYAIIDNLTEGLYTFYFYTYDSKGNKSVGIDTSGYVYGNEYESNLINRSISSAYIDLDSDITAIQWIEEADSTAIGTEINYKNKEGDVKTIEVSFNDQLTTISGRPLGDSIEYRTLYKPDKLAIDTFYSDFKTIHIKPKSILLDKSKFGSYELPSDAPTHSGYDIEGIWDGDKTGKKPGSWESDNMPTFPIWVTFDMGVSAKLDSIHVWQFVNKVSSPLFYQNANMEKFEVWGSTNPAPDGSWDGWTKLGEFKFLKPSGLPYSDRTQEDIDKGFEGDQFIFSARTIPVRYIRVKVFSVWYDSYNTSSGKAHVFIQEMNFYGVPE